MNLVVFASGDGSTLQTIIDHIHRKQLNVNISLVVSNNKNAYALKRAKENGIDTYLIHSTKKEAIDQELIEKLSNYQIDMILLAGYLKLIGPKLIQNYTIINTHPSLLPAYGGKGMYGMNVHKAVIENQEEYSGVTLHYVDENYDEGSIIKQTSVKLAKDETPDTLARKVQNIEKIQLIEMLRSEGKK